MGQLSTDIWDLDKFEGMARTTYVLDASVAEQAYVSSITTVTGTGTVTVTNPQTAPGGEIKLSVGATTGDVRIAFPAPVRWGDTTAVAAIATVEGMKYTGLRPNPWLQFKRTSTGDTNYLSMYGDGNATSLRTAASGVVATATSMQGNIWKVSDGTMSMFADYEAVTVKGHLGWSVVELPNPIVAASGYFFEFRNRSLDASEYFNHSVSFTRLSLTVIHNRIGGASTVLLK